MGVTCVVHLDGPGMSGRMVRYRILGVDEIQRNEESVAREASTDKTMSVLQYNAKVNDLGRITMIVAVTEKMTKSQRADTAPAAVKWQRVDAATLEMKWKEFFTTKDTVALRAIYDREHSVSASDLEAIMSGKAEELEG